MINSNSKIKNFLSRSIDDIADFSCIAITSVRNDISTENFEYEL